MCVKATQPLGECRVEGRLLLPLSLAERGTGGTEWDRAKRGRHGGRGGGEEQIPRESVRGCVVNIFLGRIFTIVCDILSALEVV